MRGGGGWGESEAFCFGSFANPATQYCEDSGSAAKWPHAGPSRVSAGAESPEGACFFACLFCWGQARGGAGRLDQRQILGKGAAEDSEGDRMIPSAEIHTEMTWI